MKVEQILTDFIGKLRYNRRKGENMEEILGVLQEILVELRETNSKLDNIKGIGMYTSIADVYDKLDAVEAAICSLETTVDLK